MEKNKEWADLGSCVIKIVKLFEDLPTPEIHQKQLFAKRLAQCLNPSLPIAIHQTTLNIYELLFKNMNVTFKLDIQQL